MAEKPIDSPPQANLQKTFSRRVLFNKLNPIQTESFNQDHQKNEATVKRENDKVHIQKADKKYTIQYINHATGENFNHVESDINGIFLETSTGDNYLETPSNIVNRFSLEELNLFKERGIPVYFFDVGFKNIENIAALAAESLLIAGETVIGATLIQQAAQEMQSKQISKRSFLKGIAGVAGGYLTMPAVSLVGRALSGQTEADQNLTTELMKINHLTHPEVMFLRLILRNVVLAHKEEAIGKAVKDANFLTYIGSLHSGLEDQLLSSAKDRLEFLKSTKPIWDKIVDPEYMYKLLKLEHNGKNWTVEILEDPELKDLTIREESNQEIFPNRSK